MTIADSSHGLAQQRHIKSTGIALNPDGLNRILVRLIDRFQRQMLVDLQAFFAFVPGNQLDLCVRQTLGRQVGGYRPNKSAIEAVGVTRQRWTQLSIEEIAASFNPVLRGWINYYGSYYRSMLAPILGQLDYALVRWTRRKYKSLKGSPTKARAWVKRIAHQDPGLFAHWAITRPAMAER